MQRLKTRPQFQAAMAGGIVSRTPHFALHRLGFDRLPAVEAAHNAGTGDSSTRAAARPLFPTTDVVWLGAMVPKRWARRAVTRNTIKRQIYTVGGAAHAQLPQAAYVVRLRTAFDRKQFVSATSDVLKQAVRAELQQLLARVARPATGAAVAVASATAPGGAP
ncbi:ribonuclease P protein component [uncultured Xylophilus sp.]|uniref:ribonuclease P protein component n=1 Tax=uncultured Xylophilus sp. TaxID=296832 RepID=UPI0025DBF002|nr:ribonuclease P protein component [uncultured Xylophilus sp.]